MQVEAAVAISCLGISNGDSLTVREKPAPEASPVSAQHSNGNTLQEAAVGVLGFTAGAV